MTRSGIFTELDAGLFDPARLALIDSDVTSEALSGHLLKMDEEGAWLPAGKAAPSHAGDSCAEDHPGRGRAAGKSTPGRTRPLCRHTFRRRVPRLRPTRRSLRGTPPALLESSTPGPPPRPLPESVPALPPGGSASPSAGAAAFGGGHVAGRSKGTATPRGRPLMPVLHRSPMSVLKLLVRDILPRYESKHRG
jgi:hypothetical protein